MSKAKEIEIVNLALSNLKELTGIASEWEHVVQKEHIGVDGKLTFKLGETDIEFNTEIKREVRPTQLGQIIDQKNQTAPFLLVAQNIYPTAKELLRMENIAYLDIGGNFYFQDKNHYIFIEGNKVPTIKKEKPNRAFTPTGLKIVFLLLTNEGALDFTYREIADYAHVALGNVPLVMRGLQEAGYLIPKNKNKYILTRKRELLDRWITGYAETLRPKLEMGKYRFVEKNKQWSDCQLMPGDVWGAEAAASLMTNYIEPEVKVLYTKVPKMELMKKWKLIPDANGDIELIQHFWKAPDNLEVDYAPALLIYADLIISQDARNVEVAELVFEKYLKTEFY